MKRIAVIMALVLASAPVIVAASPYSDSQMAHAWDGYINGARPDDSCVIATQTSRDVQQGRETMSSSADVGAGIWSICKIEMKSKGRNVVAQAFADMMLAGFCRALQTKGGAEIVACKNHWRS